MHLSIYFILHKRHKKNLLFQPQSCSINTVEELSAISPPVSKFRQIQCVVCREFADLGLWFLCVCFIFFNLFFSQQSILWKRSGSSLNKEWKKKYVTLSNNGTLSYHSSSSVRKTTQRLIDAAVKKTSRSFCQKNGLERVFTAKRTAAAFFFFSIQLRFSASVLSTQAPFVLSSFVIALKLLLNVDFFSLSPQTTF